MSSHCSAVTGFLFGGDENIWGHSGSGRTVLGTPSMPLSRTPKMANFMLNVFYLNRKQRKKLRKEIRAYYWKLEGE